MLINTEARTQIFRLDRKVCLNLSKKDEYFFISAKVQKDYNNCEHVKLHRFFWPE